MNSTSDSSGNGNHHSASTAIAIVLPSLFAIVLVILIVIALLLPRLNPAETASTKEERRKKRMARLDKNVKAQHFLDWASKQSAEHPDLSIVRSPLCVICLEEIEDAAQIRALDCLHVFHQNCLDDWFSRWNEYCPLCHRPIIQSAKAKPLVESPSRGARDERPVAVASMV